MARSSKIYVLVEDGEILAAFTVKHEMHTYAEREGLYAEGPHGETIKVVSLPDGGGRFGGKRTEAPLTRDL